MMNYNVGLVISFYEAYPYTIAIIQNGHGDLITLKINCEEYD